MIELEVLKRIPRVKNMKSSSGNYIPNQFIIHIDEGVVFQSYSTVIAAKLHGQVYLDEDSWDYSKTTGKYHNQFLNMNKKETEDCIKKGIIKLVNLNKY